MKLLLPGLVSATFAASASAAGLNSVLFLLTDDQVSSRTFER